MAPGRPFPLDSSRILPKSGRPRASKTIQHTAKTQPAVFFATCARLIGPEVKLTIEQSQGAGLDQADISILRAIREAIPNADKMSAEQVLGHVLDAVRAYESPVILALPKPSAT